MTFHQRGISLFHSLLPLGQHLFLSKSEVMRIAVIAAEDRLVYLVGDGLVKIIIKAHDGRIITARIARPGDVLTAPIQPPGNQPDQGDVMLQGLTGSTLLAISQSQFDGVLRSNPSFAVGYFEQLAKWHQLSQIIYSEWCNGRGVGRIRSALHVYAAGAGCAFEQSQVAIKPGRAEISQLAGLSVAHTIRLIQKMASDGEIQLDGKIIRFQSGQFGPANHYQWDSALFFENARPA
ncbi:Crp/Fnr family transcriptional regulator (plasmid) [Halopseudomonas sp. SMJS2]|uniref:Crp/Fnr family transcriptional regulator n=1 Tax=Halopseudomonas sp. SMJS2 TaxID=3041098 RepID=UPI002452DD15|nr:Crp/Fnr family transcriptional regulator [Halopseudomonas sp. SMJS2]WGK63562.1 Crp/Fnr family transcriptional regulator [Halopseudomonas sp. SMJS2]